MMKFEEIKKVLKQRFPIIMVDRVLEIEPLKKIKATKNVTGNEIFFMGHFPQYYLMPGVLIVEALAQSASIMINKRENDNEFIVLGDIKEMKFKKPVYPGDTLVMEVELIKEIENYYIVSAIAKVDDKTVAKGKLHFGKVNFNIEG